MEIAYLHRTSRILAGHLWVFSNELTKSPKDFEPGSLVELRDKRETFIGIGYINPTSLIAVRILTHVREEINADFFRKRIRSALEYRKRVLTGTDSCRLIFSEADFLPGLIVDKYADCLSVQTLTLGMDKWSDVVISILDEMFSPSVIVLRNDSSIRLLEGLKQEKTIIKGSLERLPVIKEGEMQLEIDPMSGQKTGFFLDQRENRLAFANLVSGKGLDLFCYTGAWSILTAGKATHITGIDESESAIEQATRNAEINNLSDKCEFIKTDVIKFLRDEITKESGYDFIVLDPPAFVKSKANIAKALRAYRDINANAMKLLKKGGLLATSSCSYHIEREVFMDMLRSAARDAGKQFRLIEMRSQAKDHPVLLSMPETWYLKCAFLTV